MSIFDRLRQIGNSDQSQMVLAPTPDAYHPGHLRFNDTHRGIPVIKELRTFNGVEAANFTALAEQLQSIAKTTEEAYNAAMEAESASTKIHQIDRKYQGHMMAEEAKRLEANASLQSQANALKPKYIDMAKQIAESDMASDRYLARAQSRSQQLLKEIW